MLTSFSLPAPTAPAAPAPSAAPTPASSPAPAAANSSAGGSHSAAANSPAPQSAPSSAGGSSAADRSGAAKPGTTRSDPSGKAGSAQSDNPSGNSRAGPRTTRASGASSPSSANATAQSATGSDDFSAALAQSLAGAPASGAAPANAATAATAATTKGSGKTGTGEPTDPQAKHSNSDPVATALTLLENALGGALSAIAGAVAGVTTSNGATAAATSQSGTASQASRITGGTGTASGLEALLGQSLATDLKGTAGTAAATGGSPAAAPSATAAAATATAAAAGLTAAQLTVGSSLAAQHAKPDTISMTVGSPVGSSAWSDELGAKVTWMAHQGIESASLQMSPEHLGPVQVTISVRDGQASVWFGATQPDTRAALQQSLPQLRQLFASQGLNLSDAGVSRESPRGQHQHRAGQAAAPLAGVTAVTTDNSAGRGIGLSGLGLVDTYV